MSGKESYFGAHVRGYTPTGITVEIYDCPILPRGQLVEISRKCFAPGELRAPGGYVEGKVHPDGNGPGQVGFSWVTAIS